MSHFISKMINILFILIKDVQVHFNIAFAVSYMGYIGVKELILKSFIYIHFIINGKLK